ncbi:MAG: hypothetical protein CMJ25_13975 [Phycisphaerae bacterium]|nr:hypothetical protein [Phycisphaerae bacterium]|tara:strand:+ start:130 stop:861 length:732 start_codon:yes stop_codon:yes gene_type:complete
MGLNRKLILSSETGADSAADPFGDGSCRAFYKLDSNVDDYSGNNLNGSSGSNIVFYNNTTAPYDGYAYVPSVNANSIMTFPITPIPNETHTFWIKKPVLANNESVRIFTTGSDYNSWWYAALYNISGVLKIYMQWRQGSAQYKYATASVGISVNSTDWFFMTLRTNSSSHFFSVNGGNETQLTDNLASGTMDNSFYSVDNTDMFVGRLYSNGALYYGEDFNLDHYRLFNRALTNTEIDTLYQE